MELPTEVWYLVGEQLDHADLARMRQVSRAHAAWAGSPSLNLRAWSDYLLYRGPRKMKAIADLGGKLFLARGELPRAVWDVFVRCYRWIPRSLPEYLPERGEKLCSYLALQYHEPGGPEGSGEGDSLPGAPPAAPAAPSPPAVPAPPTVVRGVAIRPVPPGPPKWRRLDSVYDNAVEESRLSALFSALAAADRRYLGDIVEGGHPLPERLAAFLLYALYADGPRWREQVERLLDRGTAIDKRLPPLAYERRDADALYAFRMNGADVAPLAQDAARARQQNHNRVEYRYVGYGLSVVGTVGLLLLGVLLSLPSLGLFSGSLLLWLGAALAILFLALYLADYVRHLFSYDRESDELLYQALTAPLPVRRDPSEASGRLGALRARA